MAEASQWNRPKSAGGDAQSTRHKAQSTSYANRRGRPFARGLLAALVVVVGGVLAFYFICGPGDGAADDGGRGATALPKKRGKIAEVTPAKPKKSAVVEKKAPAKHVMTDEERREAFEKIRTREYEGPVLDMDTYVSPDPGFSNRWERFKAEQAKLPFKYRSENEIAVILDTEPGQMILETAFMPNFERDFLKSLEETIIPSEDDDEKTAQLKRDMVQAKIILKEAYDKGENIVDILKEERAELQKIYNLRANLFQELKSIEKEAKSTQEIDDFVSAANVMLDEYGAKHIKLPYSKERMRLERAEGLIQ